MDQFRGIFRLTYAGDAHLVLKTKVQANPLNHKQPDIHLMAGSRGMLAAKQALVVPMLLRLSHFKLSSYVVLVLVFKTDPLQSVDINSTFDSIAVIQMFIQREIEGQLRQMFREDLPGIIHRLSQQWVRAKVETPPSGLTQRNLGALNPEPRVGNSAPPSLTRHNVSIFNSSPPMLPRTASVSRTNITRRTIPPTPPSAPVNSDGEPGFKSLFAPTRGLADLAESEREQDSVVTDDLDTTYDAPSSVEGDEPEYERMPAVGGGTILRPRIYHSQTQPQVQLQTPAPSHPPFTRARSELPRRPELPHNPFSAAFAPSPSPTSSRSTSPSPSHSLSLSTPPSSASAYHEPQPLTAHSIHCASHALSTLITLFHRTRAPSPTSPSQRPATAPARRRRLGHRTQGRRRRTYRINGGNRPPDVDTAAAEALRVPGPHHSEMSPSEFDVGDMDMYFRHMDLDGEPASPIGSAHLHLPAASGVLTCDVGGMIMFPPRRCG
ncbi:hypothetical protein C8R46DRAFT_1093692 [Mycena filopes]|nr:hypothetical protein C8R46DRAFT_1093692 [Mycena filopes]